MRRKRYHPRSGHGIMPEIPEWCLLLAVLFVAMCGVGVVYGAWLLFKFLVKLAMG